MVVVVKVPLPQVAVIMVPLPFVPMHEALGSPVIENCDEVALPKKASVEETRDVA